MQLLRVPAGLTPHPIEELKKLTDELEKQRQARYDEWPFLRTVGWGSQPLEHHRNQIHDAVQHVSAARRSTSNASNFMTLVVGKRTPEYSGYILTWRPSASSYLLCINGGFMCNLCFYPAWSLQVSCKVWRHEHHLTEMYHRANEPKDLQIIKAPYLDHFRSQHTWHTWLRCQELCRELQMQTDEVAKCQQHVAEIMAERLGVERSATRHGSIITYYHYCYCALLLLWY